ncbi:MAG: NAD(P)/FAD-dependent oxidoreductase [Chloroflexota bacterium]|nr:NAD(P)/FAD-dependent oxidoreductase [Chloroflexota bacterium]
MSADVDVLVVGAGHAGLGVASRLRSRRRSPVILEADGRVGQTWRDRWASLRLFTPRFVNGLPGMRFPDGDDPFPSKDEVADYQERYAEQLGVPLHLGTRVIRLRPDAEGFIATLALATRDAALGSETVRARNVVIATGAHQTPRLPSFASRLDASVMQLHSRDYGTFGALPNGPVLVVGSRNSGAEIADELARSREIWIAQSKDATPAPRRWRSTRWWRAAQLRSWALRGVILPGPLPWPLKPPGGAWIEVDLDRLAKDTGLRRVPRAVDAEGDRVVFADGSVMRPRTVIWATGFRSDDSWIDAPLVGGQLHAGRRARGPLPGLYIVRASLLASLHFGALASASDIAAHRTATVSGRSTPRP